MPIFEYRCDPCGHQFETLVRGAETPACPTCASTALTKQLSRFTASSRAPAPLPAPGSCGTCGDPRGPGSCAR